MTEKCGCKNRNGEPCQLSAGWGTENSSGPCKFHGGASPKGRDHPRFKHGGFSKYLRSDLTDEEEDAFEGMVEAYDNPEQARKLIAQQAAEAWLKYKRSGDTRFLREYRQLADTFNLAPNEDELSLSGGENPLQVIVNRERHNE